MKLAIAILLLCTAIGCGDNTVPECSSSPRDPASGWSCSGTFDVGLWACTCSGPGAPPATATTDALCAEAKACAQANQ